MTLKILHNIMIANSFISKHSYNFFHFEKKNLFYFLADAQRAQPLAKTFFLQFRNRTKENKKCSKHE